MELWPLQVSLESPRDSDQPLSTSHRSSSVNGTGEPDGVTFFILQGLSGLGDRQMILFVILLLGYVITQGGNGLIIFVTLADPKLHSPMYFFLGNLSFVDMVYTTSTIPKMLAGFLSELSIISLPGCFLQVRIIVAVLYAALTPFLNPVVFGLRNKELQESIRRTLVRFRSATVSAMKNVSTVS